MDIKELESLLKSNRLDLRSMNDQQKIFIDTLQKRGVIDVPPLNVPTSTISPSRLSICFTKL